MSVLYNSPKLFDRSDCLVENYSVNEKKHNFLFFSTFSGLEKTEAFLKSLGKAYEIYVLHDGKQDLSEKDFENGKITYLYFHKFDCQIGESMKKQKVGTQLYIAAEWGLAKKIFTHAIEAGFMEEEIQAIIIGAKERHAYCPSCYTLSPISEKDEEVQCPKCKVMLSLSPFFSKVRGGYLGYPYVD